MNKRIRSRVLAAGVASSAIFGLGAIPFLQTAAFAQDKPSAADQLDRGSRLYDQKQYAEAKKVLLDIDPAQLPEDQRGKLTDLTKNIDIELAKAQGANGGFDAAQANLDGDKLAAAATGFQGVIDDPTASSDLKDKAKIQLALVKQKQTDKAPQMKELLNQAQSLYDAGKLDEAQNAVGTVIASGSDLGWQDNAKPQQLQQKIADRKAAMASTAATPAMAPGMAMGAASAPATDMAATTTPAATTMGAMADSTTNPSTMAASTPMAGADTVAAPATDTAMNPPAPPTPTVPMAPAPAPAPAATPGVDPNSALGQTITADQIEHDRAVTLYNIQMKKSTDAMTATPPQYAVAIDSAHEAGTIVNENRRYFSDAEANALTASASRQEQLATATKGTYDTQQARLEQKTALEAEGELQKKRATEKRRRVDGLMRDAQRFVETQQYKEGADTLRQVLIIDPTNSSAKLMLALVNDRIAYRQYETVLKEGSRQETKIEIQDQEAIVPYADLLIYPENWTDITRTRLGDQSDQDSPANRATNARLQENLKEITADQLGLERVINFLQDNTGTNIFVNWKALEAAGVDRNTPVSVKLHDAPFSKVLTTVLDSVSTAKLDYTVGDGVITISTVDDLVANVVKDTRTYDIGDLLVQPDYTQPPAVDVNLAFQQGSASGSSGGTSVFGTTTTINPLTPQQQQDAIIKKITDAIMTVDAGSWVANGGSVGVIQDFSHVLLITQSLKNHGLIEGILNKIRETHAVQIAIESRIMFVNNNLFEQFGGNFSLNVPVAGFTNGLSVTSDSLTPVNALSNGGALSSVIAATPSLSVGGTFLDNFSLTMLLQATQADQRTINVASPRITLFSGEQGWIRVGRSNGYIANETSTITPGTINSAALVTTTLTPGILQTGVTLYVQAAVTADRRYVVMQVQPSLTTNDGFTNIGNSGASANATLLTGIFLQLVNIEVTDEHTTVSVPDGGTLLIGGEKVVSNQEVEIGVPILSKIPGINRLFTNRSTEKDERTLLVLIRPKIIIPKEIENNLYGPGYDRPSALPTSGTNQNVLDGNNVDPGFKAAGR